MISMWVQGPKRGAIPRNGSLRRVFQCAQPLWPSLCLRGFNLDQIATVFEQTPSSVFFLFPIVLRPDPALLQVNFVRLMNSQAEKKSFSHAL